MQVNLHQAEKVVFCNNTAVIGGGAIFGDQSSTAVTANEYNHSVAENRFGSCFMTFGNEGQPSATDVSS